MTFGEMVRSRRTELGMTQRALAEKIGVTPTMISHIERGERLPPNEQMANELALAMNAEAHTFLAALNDDKRLQEITDSQAPTLLQDMMREYLEDMEADLSATETVMEINDALQEYVAGLAWPPDATPEEIIERNRSRKVHVASVILLGLWLAELEESSGFELAVDQLQHRRRELSGS